MHQSIFYLTLIMIHWRNITEAVVNRQRFKSMIIYLIIVKLDFSVWLKIN